MLVRAENNPAVGVANGLILAVPFWAAVGALVLKVVR